MRRDRGVRKILAGRVGPRCSLRHRMDDAQRVLAEAERVLRQNWREGAAEGVPYAYTEPSPGRYPWQWYWDSCFHAIAWRRLDSARAERELRSLLAVQRPDGFIGHTIFWSEPLRGMRRLTYNVTSPRTGMTASIQPPLLAWAWRIAVGDPAEEPGIQRQVQWLAEHRDLDDVIDRLSHQAPYDQLALQRLKKRKLLLKDLIAKVESQLLPDIIA